MLGGSGIRWGMASALCVVAAATFAGCDEDLGQHNLSATPDPAAVGQDVEFYAFVRSHEDGDAFEAETVRRELVVFRWDLDGDGVFETVSPTLSPDGSSAPEDYRSRFETSTSRSYGEAQTVRIASLVSLRPDAFGALGGILGHGDASVQERTLTVQQAPPSGGPADPDPGPSPNRPPFASFTTHPNPAQPHQQVYFDAWESVDPDGHIVRYEWDLDGIGGYDRDTGSTPYTQLHFDNSGEYTVGLRVTDNTGATATTTRQVIVRWPTRTGRVSLRAPAMPRFELSPSGREVNEGQWLLNGNELILNRAKARGTVTADPFPKRLRGRHDVRWAADYVVTRDTESGATEAEAFILLTFATGGRACLGAELTGARGENPEGEFRVIGAIGKAARLRGLGTATGGLDDAGRPVVSGHGRFRLADEARFGLGKSRCGPLRRLAPQRD